MAVFYVRSTDGNNADNGSTWALAKATINGALAVASNGDTIYVSQVHSESTASAISLAHGSDTTPTKIICVNDGAQPPTATATTAVVATTGASNISLGGALYVYGITFNCGSGANRADFNVCQTDGGCVMMESCNVVHVGTNAANISCSTVAGTAAKGIWLNTNFKFANTGSHLILSGEWSINGGNVISGSSSNTAGFLVQGGSTSPSGITLIENFDFSNFSSTTNLATANSTRAGLILRNCKLPGSWSGTLLNGAYSAPGRMEMYNTDSGSTNYKIWIEDNYGTLRDETTVVRSGGASDGTTALSWKISGGGRNAFPEQVMRTPEIAVYNSTVGSSKTVTVEYLHDTNTATGQGAGTGNAFQDNQLWLEVEYPAASGTPLGAKASGRTATFLTTPADNGTGVGTSGWVTTGLTTPKSGKLSVTFTPQKIGFLLARVCLAAQNKVVYIDPKVTIT